MRDTTAGEDFSTRFISSLFTSCVCTHCQRLCISCYVEERRAEGKAAGNCHEACLAEKGNTCILQVFSAEAELAGTKQTGLQSLWSPGSRGSPTLVWSPCSPAWPLARAWLSWPRCLPVFLPWGCHKGGAEVNGAKSRINLQVLISSCSQGLVAAWPLSEHRALACGGTYGGGKKSQGLQALSFLCWGFSHLSLLRWGKHHPFWGLSSLYWYKAGRESLRGYCV